MGKGASRIRVAAPPSKPLLIFDGDCGFCRARVLRWQALTGDRVEYAPSQEAASRFPEIPSEAYARAVQFVGSDGEVCQAAEAVFRVQAFAPHRGWMLWLYRWVPGVSFVCEWFYGLVARHRGFFAGRKCRL
jgi:predicted DCC family thiol-disulfide oxidoreductase YuxK